MAQPDNTSNEQTITAQNVEVSEGLRDTHRGVKLGVDNEPFWRIWLTPQGDILVGDGMSPPTAFVSGGSGDVATDTIWDAVGDLVVGTGANTAARLAIGGNGEVLQSNGTTAAWAALGALAALDQVTIAEIDATGTPDNTTFLRGDGAWAVPIDTGATFPLDNTGATAATDAMTLDVTGDTQNRFVVNHDGSIEWGSGSAVADVTVSRSAARTLGIAASGFITIQNAADVGLTVKGAAAQTASLQEWQGSVGTVLARVMSDGMFGVPNGSAGSPSYAFYNNSNLGMYRVASGVLGFATSGVERFRLGITTQTALITNASAGIIGLTVKAASAQTASLQEWQDSAGTTLAALSGGFFYSTKGTANAPGLSFMGDTDTGIYSTLGNNIGISTGGLGKVIWDANGSTFLYPIIASDGVDFQVGSSSGTKIATATTQKLGFWNTTPVVQPAAIADVTGGSVIDTEGRAALNSLLAKLRTTGLIAT